MAVNSDKPAIHKMIQRKILWLNGGVLMTDEQRKQITELRQKGIGYLAGEMVKTKKADKQLKDSFCRECGKELHQTEGVKKKIFCCRKCREKWWHEHPGQIRQKAVYSFICAGCEKEFTAYGNSHRKYCSHECYITSRFKGGGGNG